MPTQREKIIKKIREILEKSLQGVRYSELVRRISTECPEININTIHGNIWNLRNKIAHSEIKDIVIPERGLFILKEYLYVKYLREELTEKEKKGIREEDFYKPFADYLINDLEECTKAVPLGGSRFQDKWGTPDVFGVYKFPEIDPVRPPVEIVSAEIKTNTNQLITAFGQACVYKIFSHKVYLVIPKDAEKKISRLDSLCLRFGIGLILFDKNHSENPDFEIRTRAVKSEPDYFYVNKYLKLLGDDLRKLF